MLFGMIAAGFLAAAVAARCVLAVGPFT